MERGTERRFGAFRPDETGDREAFRQVAFRGAQYYNKGERGLADGEPGARAERTMKGKAMRKVLTGTIAAIAAAMLTTAVNAATADLARPSDSIIAARQSLSLAIELPDDPIGDYTPKKTENPTDVPSTSTPVPATDEPATEAPATEAPATEVPATAVPATDVPATEVPLTAEPATNVPATEAPATEAPATAEPATEAPATAVPVTAEPATDIPATDAPATNAPVTSEHPTENPMTVAPVSEAPDPQDRSRAIIWTSIAAASIICLSLAALTIAMTKKKDKSKKK